MLAKKITKFLLTGILVFFCVLIAFEFKYEKGFTREYHGGMYGADGNQLTQAESETFSISGSASYQLRKGVRLQGDLTGAGLDCRFMTLANESLGNSGWYRALLSGGLPEPGPVSIYGLSCNEVCFSKKLDAFVFPVEQGGRRVFPDSH